MLSQWWGWSLENTLPMLRPLIVFSLQSSSQASSCFSLNPWESRRNLCTGFSVCHSILQLDSVSFCPCASLSLFQSSPLLLCFPISHSLPCSIPPSAKKKKNLTPCLGHIDLTFAEALHQRDIILWHELNSNVRVRLYYKIDVTKTGWKPANPVHNELWHLCCQLLLLYLWCAFLLCLGALFHCNRRWFKNLSCY